MILSNQETKELKKLEKNHKRRDIKPLSKSQFKKLQDLRTKSSTDLSNVSDEKLIVIYAYLEENYVLERLTRMDIIRYEAVKEEIKNRNL